MAETVDELTCDWTDESGNQVTKQIEKVVLTKGTWATILYLYQDREAASGEFGKAKARIQRYQKRGGKYISQSKFNISSLAQGKQIAETLTAWADAHGE